MSTISLYRPPSAQSEWINLFEEELSIAHSTGLEIILMGDFNIDCTSCLNRKWQNLVQLFDLSQLVSEPTRITETTSAFLTDLQISLSSYKYRHRLYNGIISK